MSDKLQKEIIIRIFENFGISLEKENNLHDLLLNDDNKLDFYLPLEIDSVKVDKSVWSAELPLVSISAAVMITDLTDEDFREFAILIQLTDLPLYGIRLSSDLDDFGSFYVLVEKKWVSVPIGTQASVLSGIEFLQNYIFNWSKNKDVENMYESLVSFLNVGDYDK